MERSILIDEVSCGGLSQKLSGVPEGDGNYFTLIVGPNGSGKTRLLRTISAGVAINSCLPISDFENNALLPVFDFQCKEDCYSIYQVGCKEVDRLFGVGYKLGKNINKIRLNEYNGRDNDFAYVSSGSVNKIICISNSLFHGFLDKNDIENILEKGGFLGYKNLALTEDLNTFRYGSDFNTKVLSRGLVKCLFYSGEHRNKYLEFLSRFGFDKVVRLDVVLRIDYYPLNVELNDSQLWELIELNIQRSMFTIKGVDLKQLKEDGKVLESFRFVVNEMIRCSKNEHDHGCHQIGNVKPVHKCINGYLIGSFEFTSKTILQEELCNHIIYLFKIGVFDVDNIILQKNDELIHASGMSSGQICTLLILMKIDSEICDGALILIDEPEVSMHPAWQGEIIPSLEKMFSSYKGCHFIIATHSPQVVASTPKINSSVVLLGNEPSLISGGDVHGKSSDFQLFNTLNYAGESNEYAIKKLLTIVAKFDASIELDKNDYDFIEKAKKLLDNESYDDIAKYLLAQTLALVEAVGRSHE
ncbi:TPA: AAA family ATPase [Klebsiella oxytoca]|nr:AAA family ATPase [Klebsiella oxytoca]HCL5973077.1 AAA family ATPase [Klebsiella oxytoca]